MGKKVKESKKKSNNACQGRRKHMLESNGDDVEVVIVSSCYCVMLCSLAFSIRVTVVSSCESELVCRSCEPQQFISQTEEHYGSGNSTPTSCSDHSTPTLPHGGVSMWSFFFLVVLASLRYLGGSRRLALAFVRLRKMVSPTKPSTEADVRGAEVLSSWRDGIPAMAGFAVP